jgi:glycosyltransferase involved in cell wall biosynthesis
MNICLFTENYFKGGLDTFIINLINEWPSKQDTLTLYCNDSHPGIGNIIRDTHRPFIFKSYNKIFTTKLSSPHYNFSGSLFLFRFFTLVYKFIKYPILFPWYVSTLTLHFKKSNFERLMVITGGYSGSILCQSALIAWKLSGKKKAGAFNFHNFAVKPKWYFKIPELFIDKAVNLSSGSIVSVSKKCIDSLILTRAFSSDSKLKFIHNGIQDPLTINLIKESKESNINLNKPFCLMLGTLEARKGHNFLLKSFKIVIDKKPDAILQIFGDGNYNEKTNIQNTIKELNLQKNVFLNSYDPNTSKLYMNASLLLVPSQRFESFGLTIIEAMAYSTPIVATDTGGIPEVIGKSNAGFICEKDNYKKFADLILKILINKDLALKMGKSGRREFEKRFRAIDMVSKYEAIIKK